MSSSSVIQAQFRHIDSRVDYKETLIVSDLIHSHHTHHCCSLWGDIVSERGDEAELSGDDWVWKVAEC